MIDSKSLVSVWSNKVEQNVKPMGLWISNESFKIAELASW